MANDYAIKASRIALDTIVTDAAYDATHDAAATAAATQYSSYPYFIHDIKLTGCANADVVTIRECGLTGDPRTAGAIIWSGTIETGDLNKVIPVYNWVRGIALTAKGASTVAYVGIG